MTESFRITHFYTRFNSRQTARRASLSPGAYSTLRFEPGYHLVVELRLGRRTSWSWIGV